jgi:integrase
MFLLSMGRQWRFIPKDLPPRGTVDPLLLPLELGRRAGSHAWLALRGASGLGSEVTPHILRHTFAGWAVQAVHSFAKISAALGTSAIVVEESCGHICPDRLRDAMASVSRRGKYALQKQRFAPRFHLGDEVAQIGTNSGRR